MIAQGVDRRFAIHLAGKEIAVATSMPILLHRQSKTADFGQNDVEVVAGHQRRVVRATQPGAAFLHKGGPVAGLNLVECQVQQVVAP